MKPKAKRILVSFLVGTLTLFMLFQIFPFSPLREWEEIERRDNAFYVSRYFWRIRREGLVNFYERGDVYPYSLVDGKQVTGKVYRVAFRFP